jgi:hypothetical protein
MRKGGDGGDRVLFLKRAIYIRYSAPIDTAKLGEILRKRGVKYEIRY